MLILNFIIFLTPLLWAQLCSEHDNETDCSSTDCCYWNSFSEICSMSCDYCRVGACVSHGCALTSGSNPRCYNNSCVASGECEACNGSIACLGKEGCYFSDNSHRCYNSSTSCQGQQNCLMCATEPICTAVGECIWVSSEDSACYNRSCTGSPCAFCHVDFACTAIGSDCYWEDGACYNYTCSSTVCRSCGGEKACKSAKRCRWKKKDMECADGLNFFLIIGLPIIIIAVIVGVVILVCFLNKKQNRLAAERDEERVEVSMPVTDE